MNLATIFVECCVCGKSLIDGNTSWACEQCWLDVPVKIRDMLHGIPDHIPEDQHERYINRIYKGI
jgi:hypothetical protein